MAAVDHSVAYRAVERGALDEASEALAALDASDDERAGAWAHAARAAGAVLDPDAFAAPALAEVAGWLAGPAEAQVAASLACAHLARLAVLGWDLPGLEAVLAEQTVLARSAGEASEAKLWLGLTECWARWLAGDRADLDPPLKAIEGHARAIGSAAIVIDAGALRALGAEARGDRDGMLAMARRTSRMARTEALPAQEHLAHVVLARARRTVRHPHLAIRILGALDRFVADPCRPWIRWERLLAGDAEAIEGEKPAPSASRAEQSAGALASLLRAALAGERAAFDRAAEALSSATAGIGFASRDARHVLCGLDARIDPSREDAEIAAWCGGREALAPPSLHGLCVRIDDEARDASEAVVLAGPGKPPRRVLGVGAALIGGGSRTWLKRTSRRKGRAETLVAVLACAGANGISDEECFARSYEMAYDRDTHKGMFEVLVTRARLYLEKAGEIVRGDGRIAMHLRVPIAVPDPQCAAQLHDQILRVLAREGSVTAGDAAERVGLSLRAVQQALRSLAEDGVCVGEKEGRQITYAVEDTTFSEPTQQMARRRRADEAEST